MDYVPFRGFGLYMMEVEQMKSRAYNSLRQEGNVPMRDFMSAVCAISKFGKEGGKSIIET